MKINRRFVALTSALAALTVSNHPVSAATHLRITGNAVKGELLVKRRGSSIADRPSLQLLKLPESANLAATARALRADPAVEFAEPNYVVRAFDDGIPDDPLFGKQWNLGNTGQADSSGQAGTAGADIHIVPVWAQGIKGDKRILVAVIDTGVDYTHPDLVANTYTNPGEIPGNGIDDDGNGYVDDVHGWNSRANNGDALDDNGHGTHSAGVIGAAANNAVGIAGINQEVSILPIKFLSADGDGTILDAIKAIEYARKMKVKVMSNSWGGNDFSQALKEAIEEAEKDGILFVAAAGNSAADLGVNPSYPAGYDVANVVAVAATDNQDRLSVFSNYGKSVHLAAPGVRITSTVLNGGYATWSGTSMAAPHVAGVAALLASVRGDLSPEQIRTTLVDTSDRFPLPAGKELIGGRVNAFRAILGR